MGVRDIRLLARSGLVIDLDIYDVNDVLLQTMTMTEIGVTGIYRANVTAVTGHWIHAHSSNNTFNVISRIGPSAADLMKLSWARLGNNLVFTNIATGLEVHRFVIPPGTSVQSFVDGLMGYLAQDMSVKLV